MGQKAAMLDEKYRLLLTAYVDGELSARQRRAVDRLLQRSPEARDFLTKLKADSDALINLPPPPAPDFTGSVLQAIAQRGLRPHRRPARPSPTVSPWVAITAAAAVLIAVGGVSYLISALSDRDDKPPVVKHKPKEGGTPRPDDRTPPGPDRDTAQKPKSDGGPKEKPQRAPDEFVKRPDSGKGPERPDEPRDKPDDPRPGPISTAPSMEVFQPNAADVAVPVLLKLSALADEGARKALTREMARSEALYLEVLSKEATHAFPRLQAVFEAAGVEVIVDRSAQERLKQPQIKGSYCIYLEDVTPEQIAKLLAALGQEDPKADKKKPAFGQFASIDVNLIFCPMTQDHRRRLIAHLGADPRQAAKPTGPLGVDVTKPISDLTLQQVPDALGETKPASKAERSALALSYTPGVNRQPTPEVKRYLDGRKPARKGTVQVMLILRSRP